MSDTNLENNEVTDKTTEQAAEEQAAEPVKLQLDVAIEKPSDCQRHVTVSVSREDIDRYFTEKFDEIMPEAAVPGFRPGRAPRKLVESRFRKQIAEQVKGKLLMDSLSQVSDQFEFSPISEPDFDYEAVEIPDEGPFTYEFDIEVRPEFETPNWKKLKIEKPVRDFTEDDVEQHLNLILEDYGERETVDGPAEAEDFVTCNIAFRSEGKVVSRLKAEEVRVKPVLSFPDGKLDDFDKLMIGAKAGDTRQGEIVVSEDAPAPELRGKTVQAEFEVLEVARLKLPELNDEILSDIGNFETADALREAIRSELERQLTYHQKQKTREQITKTLTASANWQLPPETVRRQATRELERAIMELQSSGFSEDDIRAHANELRRNSLVRTQQALKEHFILEQIAEEEKIEPVEADYELEIMKLAIAQGENPRRIKARLEKRGGFDTLRNYLVENRVLSMIEENAEFNETPYQARPRNTYAVEQSISGFEEVETDIPEAKYEDNSAPLSQPADRT